MHWNPDNFSEYGQTTDDYDYSNPTYYQQETTSSPHSGQPVQSLDAYPDALEDKAAPVGNYDHYDPAAMSPYRGPTHLDSYTADVGAEQREAAERGHVSDGKKRKGLAGLTAIISVVAYSFLFGWPFAIGLVALLFLHEMGHAIVMKLKGIPVGGMIFIPMLGAAVFMNQMPKNAKDEAEVGIAGPIAGAIASSVC